MIKQITIILSCALLGIGLACTNSDDRGGGIFSLSPMTFAFDKPYNVTVGDSMHYIMDLSDPDLSLRVIPSGISGNFLSPHYDDQIEMYLKGKYRPFVFSREKVNEQKKYRLLLIPSP